MERIYIKSRVKGCDIIELHGLIGKEILQLLTPPSLDLRDGFQIRSWALLDRKSSEDHENVVKKALRVTVIEFFF